MDTRTKAMDVCNKKVYKVIQLKLGGAVQLDKDMRNLERRRVGIFLSHLS